MKVIKFNEKLNSDIFEDFIQEIIDDYNLINLDDISVSWDHFWDISPQGGWYKVSDALNKSDVDEFNFERYIVNKISLAIKRNRVNNVEILLSKFESVRNKLDKLDYITFLDLSKNDADSDSLAYNYKIIIMKRK